jgi:hypothetical protein
MSGGPRATQCFTVAEPDSGDHASAQDAGVQKAGQSVRPNSPLPATEKLVMVRDESPLPPKPWAPVGGFRYIVRDDRWEWSDEVARMHGYKPGTVARPPNWCWRTNIPTTRRQ